MPGPVVLLRLTQLEGLDPLALGLGLGVVLSCKVILTNILLAPKIFFGLED